MDPVLEAAWRGLHKRLYALGDCSKSDLWTNQVMAALHDLRPHLAEHTHLDPQALTAFHHCPDVEGHGNKEYICDFTWTTLPVSFRFENHERLGAETRPFEVLLAAESEWGTQSNPKENYTKVLQDFRKIVDIKARYKTMVYGCHLRPRSGPSAVDLREAFERILRLHGRFDPTEQWLFFGIPWEDDIVWEPQIHVVSRDSTHGVKLVELPAITEA